MEFNFSFGASHAVGFALLGAGLSVATPAAALDCAKANKAVEKRICGNASLKAADAAMGRAYTALLKRAPDAEIRAMLVKSQRRWIEARDKGLDTDFEGNSITIGEIRNAIASRTSTLNDTSKDGLIAVAQEQKRYFAQFPAAQYSGFQTYCDFVPSDREGTRRSYACFGDAHVQSGTRICDFSIDWATFAEYDHYGVSKVLNGNVVPQAYCDGRSEHGCDSGSSDWQFAVAALTSDDFPTAGREMDKIDAEAISPSNPNYALWFKACTSSTTFPR